MTTYLSRKILTERYYHAESRAKGNEIVRQFIIDRQLIVTGGLVIDCALKRAGKKGIYEDFEVPDYDFFSRDNAKDASDLFKILMKAGFENLSLLPGIHPSTVKVFIFKDCIADITYASKSLFKEMEKSVFIYDDMRMRGLNFQYADIHRALSYPYENEPRETINNRWKKDFERFIMLKDINSEELFSPKSEIVERLKGYIDNPRIPAFQPEFADYPIAGLKAINYYYPVFSHSEKITISSHPEKITTSSYSEKITTSSQNGEKPVFSQEEKKQDNVYLMTKSDYEKFLTNNGKFIKELKSFKPYREILPARSEFLFKGIPTTILHCDHKTSIINIGKHKIVSLNFCIMYAFGMYLMSRSMKDSEKLPPYFVYYVQLLDIAFIAYSSLSEKTDGPSSREKLEYYFPSPLTYGEEIENPILSYMAEHPEAKIPQVHIKTEDDEDVIAEQLGKLPYGFKYDPNVYELDGS